MCAAGCGVLFVAGAARVLLVLLVPLVAAGPVAGGTRTRAADEPLLYSTSNPPKQSLHVRDTQANVRFVRFPPPKEHPVEYRKKNLSNNV